MWRRWPVVLIPLMALPLVMAACSSSEEDVATQTASADQYNSSQPTATQPAQTEAPTPTNNPNCPAPSGDAPEPSMKTYPAAPSEDTIDASKTYFATVKTVRGDIKIKLRPDLAPKTVASFVFLANDHYFDGVTFHRVVPGFMAQTGDPTGTGSGGPGYTLPAEFTNDVKFTRGIVGMARLGTDVNSAGSQWFIMFGDAQTLDGHYTIFGEVTEGMDVVDCLTPRDPAGLNPPPGDKIISVTIEEQ
jgi:cyclophilin family peptidyl-prolyl cis-trans isomerase